MWRAWVAKGDLLASSSDGALALFRMEEWWKKSSLDGGGEKLLHVSLLLAIFPPSTFQRSAEWKTQRPLRTLFMRPVVRELFEFIMSL